MRHSHSSSVRQQANFLRRQYLQDARLPFTNVLTQEFITQALTAVTDWLDRVFSPLVTLWVFLRQIFSADHSCRAAVARLIAHRLARGDEAARDSGLLYAPGRSCWWRMPAWSVQTARARSDCL